MLNSRDTWDRKIDYLRISITDRCNLRCQYCMPPEGIIQKSHDDILRYEDILQIVAVGTELGIKKIRITGGEPLVRLGVIEFVEKLNQIPGLVEISMTTNGILLAEYAQSLKKAGLSRVNISLDSLQKNRFEEITRRDNLDQVMVGIQAALKFGLSPVKVNMVVIGGINDDEIMDFVDLSRRYPIHVRFIEFMPLGRSNISHSEGFVSLNQVKEIICDNLHLIPIGVKGSGPAESYTFEGTKGTIGFIAPLSHNFCSKCNRLRLTADGRLRPCLDNNLEIDLHEQPGRIGDNDFIRNRFIDVLRLKPNHHSFLEEGNDISNRNMFQIGG